MNPELIVLRLRGEQVIEVSIDGAGFAPQYADAAREFGRLIAACPDGVIAWYDERIAPFLADVTTWPSRMRHPLEVLHLSCFQRCDRMAGRMGLVDFDSPFLLPGPRDRRYATWLISPLAGIGRARAFGAAGFEPALGSFAAALFDVGYRGAQAGLCPYSAPALLAQVPPDSLLQSTERPLSDRELAALIRRIYGRKWLLFWLLASGLFEHRLALPGRLASRPDAPHLDQVGLEGLRPGLGGPHPPAPSPIAMGEGGQGARRLAPAAAGEGGEACRIDAIIPTLGRPQHVLNLLRDLAGQSVPPANVIVVEQLPDDQPSSQLASAAASHWPFAITLLRADRIGACHARNLGLSASRAEWLLLLDDDVRLRPDCIAYLLRAAEAYSVEAVTAAVHLPHQDPQQLDRTPRIWAGFASGASLLARQAATRAGGFDEWLEGGYGEDYEYGVRLRLSGTTILYAPGEPILHLKAPSGGFRAPFPHPWQDEAVLPRPSPTVLYSRHKHVSELMRQGYQLFYWAGRLAATPPYRLPWELPLLARQWRSAVRWSKWLAHE